MPGTQIYLLRNLLAAGIAICKRRRADHFSPRLFRPFALLLVPLACLGRQVRCQASLPVSAEPSVVY